MIVLDTGVVVAALDRDDRRHRACRSLLEQTDERLIVPAPIIPEVDYFIGGRLGPEAMAVFLGDARKGAYQIEDLSTGDLHRIIELITAYADLDVGFVDASVLTIAERLGAIRVATLDRRHFGTMRPRHVASLELLP
ncbi:MAG: PIN domain-containing protein [Actinomycetota bacterium]